MGIRNPQNSEEQPRKSGSLVELGEGVHMAGVHRPRKGAPVPSLGVHSPTPPRSCLRGFPRGWRRGREAGAKVRGGGPLLPAQGPPPCPLLRPQPPPHPAVGALREGWEDRGRLRERSGGAAPPRPAPSPSALREAAARLARLPPARLPAPLPPPSQAQRSAASSPPTAPRASPGDRAARARPLPRRGRGPQRAGGGSWHPPCGQSSGSWCCCSGRLPER